MKSYFFVILCLWFLVAKGQMPNDDTCVDQYPEKFCPELTSYNCYFHKDICCLSCSKFKTNDSACLYGDKAIWCRSYVGEDEEKCLRDNLFTTCCQTCKNITEITSTSSSETTTTPGETTQRTSDGSGNTSSKKMSSSPTISTTSTSSSATSRKVYMDRNTTKYTTPAAPTRSPSPLTTIKNPIPSITTRGPCVDELPQYFCESLSSHQCYKETKCCESCIKFLRNKPNCKYGDKSAECIKLPNTELCSNPQVSEDCCEFCNFSDVIPSSSSIIVQNISSCFVLILTYLFINL